MDQLRFDAGLGTYNVSVAPTSVGILKGMGAHCFQLQLEIGIPDVGAEAGRLLCLDTTLYAPQATGPRAPLASSNVFVAFNPASEIRRESLRYFISNAQLLALEQRRVGDLHLELEVRGFLPQASGFPGGPVATEYLSVAESRWREQLAGLGRTLGVEMMIPFPADDEPRRDIARFLREAQRLLGGNEVEGAMLQVRKALETIKATVDWHWPGGKSKQERTADERWAWIRAALEDQASGAMHEDAGTKGYTYSRAEADALIAMTGALLSIVP